MIIVKYFAVLFTYACLNIFKVNYIQMYKVIIINICRFSGGGCRPSNKHRQQRRMLSHGTEFNIFATPSCCTRHAASLLFRHTARVQRFQGLFRSPKSPLYDAKKNCHDVLNKMFQGLYKNSHLNIRNMQQTKIRSYGLISKATSL